MALSNNHVKDVCLLKQKSYQCRYLRFDDMSGYQCQKLIPEQKDKEDSKVRLHIIECRDKKEDPRDSSLPMGNNCQGYPKFLTLIQGYDQS